MRLPHTHSRIEFNQKNQHFHLDNGTHTPNTYNWDLIASCELDEKASLFCHIMQAKYDLPNQPKNPWNVKVTSKLTTKKVKEEWNMFNKTWEGAMGFVKKGISGMFDAVEKIDKNVLA